MRNSIIAIVVILTYILLINKYPHALLNPGELVKGHQSLTNKCNSCHEPFWGIPNDKCIACHKLEEIGKTQDTNSLKIKTPFHLQLANEKCTTCHSDHNGIIPTLPYSGFKHELLGGNVKNQCNNCHNKPSDKLHVQLSSECANCHNTDAWKITTNFDHSLIQGSDKNNCASCHKIPEDNFHASLKDNCSKCHNTDKWIPATFDHSAYFVLDQDHNAKCNVCHQNKDFRTYTCYGCHEHSEGKLSGEHNEKGIYNFSKCLTCHKSSNKHEIEGYNNSEHSSKKNEGGRKEKEGKDDDD